MMIVSAGVNMWAEQTNRLQVYKKGGEMPHLFI